MSYWKPTLGGHLYTQERDAENLVSAAQKSPRSLPIHAHREELLYILEECPVLVLAGETGSGKSTQVPQFLRNAGWTQGGRRIVCTQPRRMAAITVATQVSSELKVKLGEEVGYAVRFDSRYDLNNKRSEIKYATDGLLLRETLSDPLLSQYSVVMVDESHERSLHSDVLMGLLKKILRKRPQDFRIIVSSASMDARLLESFFEQGMNMEKTKKNARILSVQGQPYPVDVCYLDAPCRDFLSTAVETVLSIHLKEGPGDILVFLPGGEEIDRAIDLLNEKTDSLDGEQNLIALPLYGSLPYRLQMRVFETTETLLPASHSASSYYRAGVSGGKKRTADVALKTDSVRKVIFATNIAETSVTIDGLRFVIDAGFTKQPYFDVESGVDSLITCVSSKAAAVQRAGRAGRTQPGKCFRLFTEEYFSRPVSDGGPREHNIPDMQRTDVTWAALQLKAVGVDDILHFDFPSPPSPASLIYALELLYALGALDDKGTLTSLGLQLAELPLNPRMSKCLLEAKGHFQCVSEMLSIAAMCSIDFPFQERKGKGKSNKNANITHEAENRLLDDCIASFANVKGDHITLLKVYNAYVENNYSSLWCKENCLQHTKMQKAREVRNNLARLLKCDKINTTSSIYDESSIRRCLVSGYFSNAAQLQSNGKYKTLRGDLVYVSPHRYSILNRFHALPEWVIYHEVISSSASTSIREITKIHPRWLVELAGHYYSIKEGVST